ncbi:LysR family transcriptional regulator [Umezawaea sp. Da 62-37]|uniref:LysR substrate-binding domain-containing protein n=1 Tax=Umezawaea sp. Da 62-37 TaxID=3075927 RepID=UPI0028F6DEB3|nr:LysR family transcriptional regulator [Umezawaea sp. Da 62-37]WNV88087.1 LysR family transcriptional regulator [Umezawaea sp. Da 62-37]
MELGLRHLRVVVAVAEAGSVSRAASILRIAQPGLTAQLGRIEREFGAPLFVRRPQGVEPTELGTQVLLGARAVIAGFEDLVATARRKAHSGGSTTAVRLGGVDSPWIPAVASVLRGLLPGHEQITYVEDSPEEVVELVRAGGLDLAVITEFPDVPAPTGHRLVVREVDVEPLLVGLRADHPDAARDRVRLADLAGHDWIAPPDRAGGLRRSLRTACERAGFLPRFRHFGVDQRTAATIVASGTAVGLFPAHTGQLPGVVFRTLVDEPLWCRTSLLWQPGSPVAGVADELAGAVVDERFGRRHQPFRVVDRVPGDYPRAG